MDMKYDQFIHPEIRSGEVLFTNANSDNFETMPYLSKRKGEKAYDGEGNILIKDGWLPVFITEEEVKNSGKTLMELRREWNK